MTSHIVDASVVVRSFVNSSDRSTALAAFSQSGAIAPELILVEVSNALWKYVRAGQITVDDASWFVSGLASSFERLVPAVELVEAAFELACRHSHPAYDCFYLALAMREDLPLLTADRRLAAIGEKVGVGTVLLP